MIVSTVTPSPLISTCVCCWETIELKRFYLMYRWKIKYTNTEDWEDVMNSGNVIKHHEQGVWVILVLSSLVSSLSSLISDLSPSLTGRSPSLAGRSPPFPGRSPSSPPLPGRSLLSPWMHALSPLSPPLSGRSPSPSFTRRSPSFTGRPHPLQDDPHPNEQSLCRRVCCQSLTMIWPIWHWQHRHMQKTVWNQWIASANISKWLWPDVSIWHLLIMEIDKHLTSDICQSDQEFLNVTYVNTYTNPWQLSVDLVVWP